MTHWAFLKTILVATREDFELHFPLYINQAVWDAIHSAADDSFHMHMGPDTNCTDLKGRVPIDFRGGRHWIKPMLIIQLFTCNLENYNRNYYAPYLLCDINLADINANCIFCWWFSSSVPQSPSYLSAELNMFLKSGRKLGGERIAIHGQISNFSWCLAW